MEALVNLFDKYHSQIIILLLGVTLIVLGLIAWIWISNKRKYHNLKHQIPAYVVKNYLDSIIQNSSALKSSLFRGGGLDVDPASIPSVMPVDQMTAESQIAVDLSNAVGDEELKAEVARLQSQLATKNNTIRDLEGQNTDLGGQVKNKQERIEELEALLASDDSGSDNSELIAELEAVKTHRDQLQEEVDSYGMIQDDLANLKRLKQENAQLKAALEQSGESLPEVEAEAEAEAVVEPEAEPEMAIEEEPVVAQEAAEEQFGSEQAPVADAEETIEPAAEEVVQAEAAEPEAPKDEASDDKSPEDLLSEFEKMLG